VQISEHPQIACWGFDREKKENYIFINPKVLRFPVNEIQLILRHEILHYAGYINLEAQDHDKANITMDIVINKILTLVYDKAMKELCRKVYPEQTKKNIVALARPDIDPRELKENRRLWQSIWNNKEIPSPASIYHRITTPKAEKNPFSADGNSGSSKIIFRQILEDSKNGKFEELSTKSIDDLTEKLNASDFSSVKLLKDFKEIFVHKKSCDCQSVDEFILKLESRQKLEETSTRIISALDNRSSCQLYPYELSRLGIIYVACGISKRIPIFWNRTPESRKDKLAIYIDTSPSMEPYQEKEVFLIDKLKGYFPTNVYCFADEVEEIVLEDFARGNYREGYSTSFDAVIEHLLESEHDAGVIFTDGYSDVDSENENRFKQSRKRLFTVYFSNNGDVKSDLDKLSEQVMTIKED